MEKKPRIAWVDILRLLGMTLIYWGHLGPSDNVILYIFAHHVPLFFFISGFFAGKNGELSFPAFLWKKVRQIVFPYVFFTLLYYALQLANGSLSFRTLLPALLVSAKGVRNQVPGPLWFFPCLFLVCILYEIIRRILALAVKNERAAKAAVLSVCVLFYLVAILFLGHEPAQDPRWIWNADSAFLYLLYYALGALLFPVIVRWKYAEKKTAARIRFFVFFALSVLFGLFFLLYGARATQAVKDGLDAALAPLFISGQVSAADAVFELYGLFSAVILIFLELCLARFFSCIPHLSRFLSYVGKDSLYHCGNELIIKYFGGLFLSATGLSGALSGDLFSLLYSVLCLIVLSFTLNLCERLLLGRLFRNY